MIARSLRRRGVRSIACALALTTTMVCGLRAPARAMLAPASAAPGESVPRFDRSSDVETVRKALESKIVRHRLTELGLSEQEIDARLSRLSDQQLHQLATNIRSIDPGGDATLAGALVVVALVLLIIYLLNRV